MVFFTHVLIMRPRNRKFTAQALKEFALQVYTQKGVIRRLSNEGIMRPYRRFRDSNATQHQYVRYVQLQVDLGTAENKKLHQVLRDHPDVLRNNMFVTEINKGMRSNPQYFPLDSFTRHEEEINWPPQVSTDVYEQMDMNWKEFSRTRWSNFLRS
jgi:hypothetical protein